MQPRPDTAKLAVAGERGQMHADGPTPVEMLDDVLGVITGLVTLLLPLFILALPGVVLLGVLVVPLAAAAGALAAIAAAVIAPPYLLVRSVRRVRAARR